MFKNTVCIPRQNIWSFEPEFLQTVTMGKKKPLLCKKTADEVASELLQFQHIQSLTKIRGNARREITNTCKAIRALIAEEGSRSTITRLLGEASNRCLQPFQTEKF